MHLLLFLLCPSAVPPVQPPHPEELQVHSEDKSMDDKVAYYFFIYLKLLFYFELGEYPFPFTHILQMADAVGHNDNEKVFFLVLFLLLPYFCFFSSTLLLHITLPLENHEL